MNIQNQTGNHKLLAVILGVALCATVGVSLAYAQTAGPTGGTGSQTNVPPKIDGSVNLQQMLLSSVKTKFTDAANTAAGAVTNGQIIGGSLTVIQGSVVYAFEVVDGTNIYSVMVDVGDGKVLYTSPGHPIQIGALLGRGHSGMIHKSHMGGGAWKSPHTSTTSPTASSPSTGT